MDSRMYLLHKVPAKTKEMTMHKVLDGTQIKGLQRWSWWSACLSSTRIPNPHSHLKHTHTRKLGTVAHIWYPSERSSETGRSLELTAQPLKRDCLKNWGDVSITVPTPLTETPSLAPSTHSSVAYNHPNSCSRGSDASDLWWLLCSFVYSHTQTHMYPCN